MFSRYITMANTMVSTMDSHRGMLNHRNRDANTYAQKEPSVPAAISNPSGAMETVAARAKIVTVDMARSMLTALATEKNAVPFMAVKMIIEAIRITTAAQSTNNFALLLLVVCIFNSSGIMENLAFISLPHTLPSIRLRNA